MTNKKGIYTYVLTRNEKHLNLRTFDKYDKNDAYKKQDGKCNICHKHFELKDMQADHITPWSKEGKTILSNCQMLCADCNRRKGNI